ncbi:MAG TPA: nitroreductase family protein, partial [Acidimicrobiales bacterium]|nr:nitroreductase family protein [Acidimicrobiales bacterium]
MDINEALYTTRAMRRVRPDPVPLDVQAKILDAAIRAPTGGNTQNWRFLLVDDRAVVSQIGPLYRDSIEQLWKTIYADRLAAARENPDVEENIQMVKVQRSAQWLADHFEEVPLYLFGFVQADPTGGSIFPAIWSAQLAARADGVGSALTSVLGIFHGEQALRILGVPE